MMILDLAQYCRGRKLFLILSMPTSPRVGGKDIDHASQGPTQASHT